MIIDSHCHLHDEKFDHDLDEVLLRATKENIDKFITIGCDIPTTKKAQSLAHKYDNIFFTAGFHPHDAKELSTNNYNELKVIAKEKKCVAIGEIGLDYYYEHSDKEQQKSALIKQIELAQELSLPIIIHLRDAHDDCVDILSKRAKGHKILIHCFSGTLEEAKIFVEMDCHISLSGIITFKKPGQLPEVAKNIPLERLIIETDAPYLAPHPFRGKRNEPSYIRKTLDAVIAIRDEEASFIEQQIYQNTSEFFGLTNA